MGIGKKIEVIEVSCRELEDFIEAIYGVEFIIQDDDWEWWGDGEGQSFRVRKAKLNACDRELLEAFMVVGNCHDLPIPPDKEAMDLRVAGCDHDLLRVLLTDMTNKDLIEEGKYVIEMSE